MSFVVNCRKASRKGAWRVRLDEFVEAHYASLFRTAFLLTGDHNAAEDLLQEALVKSWSFSRRTLIERPGAFVRRCMVNQ